MEGKTLQIDNITSQYELPAAEASDLKNSSMVIKREIITVEASENLAKEASDSFSLSHKMEAIGRCFIFLICAGVIVIGRFSVPDNRIECVQDKIMDAFKSANDFINTPGNETYRDFFQILCSLFVDAVFLSTFAYWIARGKSVRLPATLGIFYIVRGLVQKVWYSPYPEGFYWKYPGVPSIAVHYGGGSDFFFSGHSGFMVICASEWHKIKMPKVRNLVICAGIYTMAILVIYRIHYSIDVFTGVIFAEWCYMKVDLYKEHLDNLWAFIVSRVGRFFSKNYSILPLFE